MTYAHDEANARLLDLVYGEAAPVERAALEAHVAGCARCQAELAALGGTRAVVRAALVDEAAPKGVHARLMQAATEAVAPARAAAAAVAAPAARARVAEPQSFWERLRRGWTLPTFATVGAFAILLLASKVFLNPQSTYERGQQGLIPAEPAPAETVRDVEPASGAAVKSEDKAGAPAARADAPAPDPQLRRQVGIARDRAVATALGKSMRHEHGAEDLSGLLGGDGAKEAFGSGETRAKRGGTVPGLGTLHGVSGSAEGGGAAANVGGVSSRAGASAAKPASRPAAMADDFAAPPSGWKGGAPAAAPASPAPPPAPSKKTVHDDSELDRVSAAKADRGAREETDEREAAPVRKATASESPPVEKKKMAPPPVAAAAPAAQAPAKDEPEKAASDAKDRDGASAQDVLARRAEQLFVQRRWDEAVAAYRELLRRFPDADPAAKWRTRMAQAERESTEVTASRAAAKPAPKAESKPKAKAATAPAAGF